MHVCLACNEPVKTSFHGKFTQRQSERLDFRYRGHVLQKVRSRRYTRATITSSGLSRLGHECSSDAQRVAMVHVSPFFSSGKERVAMKRSNAKMPPYEIHRLGFLLLPASTTRQLELPLELQLLIIFLGQSNYIPQVRQTRFSFLPIPSSG